MAWKPLLSLGLLAAFSLLGSPVVVIAAAETEHATKFSAELLAILESVNKHGALAARSMDEASSLHRRYTMRSSDLLCSVVPKHGVSVQQLRHKLEASPHISVLTESDFWVDAFIGFGVMQQLHDWPEVDYVKAAPQGAVVNQGLAVSQAVNSVRANLVHSELGFTGAGVTVGVISDSANSVGGGILASQLTGDLPLGERVVVDPEPFCGTLFSCSDEGRAMCELIYDVAPGVNLRFKSGFLSAASMAEAILSLGAHSQVVVDDLRWHSEPMFFDGVIAQAARLYVEQMGGNYATSAGNYASSSYEANFNPSGSLHLFESGGTSVALSFSPPSTVINLQWDETWRTYGGQGATTVLGIEMGASTLSTMSCDNFAAGDDPVRFCVIQTTAVSRTTVQLRVSRVSGTDTPFFKLLFYRGSPSFALGSAGTIFGQANVDVVNSVGAVFYQNTPAYGGTLAPESFSSAGGVLLRRNTAQQPLAQFVDTQKPDISAPDGTDTTFFGVDVDFNGRPNFFGTSAAAPHLAAVIALMLEAAQTQRGVLPAPALVKSVLQATSMPMPQAASLVGAGFVDARAAVPALIEQITSSPSSTPSAAAATSVPAVASRTASRSSAPTRSAAAPTSSAPPASSPPASSPPGSGGDDNSEEEEQPRPTDGSSEGGDQYDDYDSYYSESPSPAPQEREACFRCANCVNNPAIQRLCETTFRGQVRSYPQRTETCCAFLPLASPARFSFRTRGCDNKGKRKHRQLCAAANGVLSCRLSPNPASRRPSIWTCTVPA